jgi:Uma2 family endonuclease
MNPVQMAPLTVEDYRLLPETGPRYQLIEGALFMAPAPNRFHQNIALNVAVILYRHLEKHAIGSVFTAPFDVYLDEINAVQPDVVFVAKGNDILTAQGASGAPDFVVEVLSPKTAHLDKNPSDTFMRVPESRNFGSSIQTPRQSTSISCKRTPRNRPKFTAHATPSPRPRLPA